MSVDEILEPEIERFIALGREIRQLAIFPAFVVNSVNFESVLPDFRIP